MLLLLDRGGEGLQLDDIAQGLAQNEAPQVAVATHHREAVVGLGGQDEMHCTHSVDLVQSDDWLGHQLGDGVVVQQTQCLERPLQKRPTVAQRNALLNKQSNRSDSSMQRLDYK